MAYRLIPGTHHLNLHVIYGDTAGETLARNDPGDGRELGDFDRL
jgi:L-rhamnose isomerase